MGINEIMQYVCYGLAGLIFIGLIIFLCLNKEMKWKSKLGLLAILVLSFGQTFIYLIMTLVK